MIKDMQGNAGVIDWGATAKVALARGLCASAVWTGVAAATEHPSPGDLIAFYVQEVAGIAIGAPLMDAMVRGLRRVLFMVPLATLVCSIIIGIIALVPAVGDPLLFWLNRRFPHLLGVADFKSFNLTPAILVRR